MSNRIMKILTMELLLVVECKCIFNYNLNLKSNHITRELKYENNIKFNNFINVLN